jgi:hypothetical protein
VEIYREFIMDANIKKYPKSKHNFQCLGPCYYAGTKIRHPITLQIVTNQDNFPFCAVSKWTTTDPKTGNQRDELIDGCYNPVHMTSDELINAEINMLLPLVEFNVEQFLKMFYKIFSFEDGIAWIESNKHKPFLTKVRILRCILKVYGKDIEIIDNRIVDFFIEIIKFTFAKELYTNLSKYVKYTNNEFYLSESDNNNIEIKDIETLKLNYLLKTFVNSDEIHKFLMRYIRNRKDNWNDINDHINNALSDLIIYIENKINMTLQ